jgi:Flp pilus assembly protein CpaB
LGYVTRDIVINPGEPIRKADLLGHVTEVGISGLVRLGERAMVIPLNQPTLHDLVKAGDYVDVVAAFEGQESNTIVRGARVLAVDVFGKEYPDVSVAMRGPHKHPPANADVNAVPTPTPTADPNAPPAQQAAPAPAAQTAEPDDEAPPPATALTLEVTPEEATRISLAQAANARIDFILIPREEVVFPVVAATPGVVSLDGDDLASATIETVASTILPEVAPYSVRQKRAGATTGQTRTAETERQDRQQLANRLVNTYQKGMDEIVGSVKSQIPTSEGPETNPMSTDGLPGPVPAPTPTPLPETYQVKIIPDGKEARYETVLKPKN